MQKVGDWQADIIQQGQIWKYFVYGIKQLSEI